MRSGGNAASTMATRSVSEAAAAIDGFHGVYGTTGEAALPARIYVRSTSQARTAHMPSIFTFKTEYGHAPVRVHRSQSRKNAMH